MMKHMAAVAQPAQRRWRRPDVDAAPSPVQSAVAQAAVTPAESVQTGNISFWFFCLLTYVIVGRPNDYIVQLVPLRLALVTTIITALVTLAERKVNGPNPFQLRETKIYLTFYAALLFGIPFAMHRGVTFDLVVITYASNMIYFLLFVTHVTTKERLRQVLWVLVVGAFIFSAFGLTMGRFVMDRFFIGSGMYDPNDAAYVQLALLPFTLCILLGSSTMARRGVALAAALIGLLIALYTASRGGLLGYLMFVILFLNLKMGILKPIHKATLLVVVAIAVAFNVDKINTERLMTITNIQNDYNYSEEWGRTDVWKNGVIMFMQDPLTGVGAGNFAMAIANRRESFGLLPKWQAPHSSFVQVLTETGIVGFIAWLMLVISSAKTFWKIRKRDPSMAGGELTIWAGVLFAGFVASTLSASFLTMGYSIFFTTYFAVAVALRRIAETTPVAAPAADAPVVSRLKLAPHPAGARTSRA